VIGELSFQCVERDRAEDLAGIAGCGDEYSLQTFLEPSLRLFPRLVFIYYPRAKESVQNE